MGAKAKITIKKKRREPLLFGRAEGYCFLRSVLLIFSGGPVRSILPCFRTKCILQSSRRSQYRAVALEGPVYMGESAA